MKRIFVILVFVLILQYVSGCVVLEDRNSITFQENSQYVLKPITCKSFFGCQPKEAEQVLINSYWAEGHFQSAIVDEKGNLILTLSKEDIEHWSNYINQLIQKRSELDAGDGCRFIVDDDYKSIESHVTKELYPAAGYNIGYISIFCGIMQMLNGNDFNNWYVDIKMFDVETEILIQESRFPVEKFEVSNEDWDRALNSAESNTTDGQ